MPNENHIMPAKPILYYTDVSPPVRSVLLTAAAIDVDLDLRVVNFLTGDQLKPEFIKLNPQHTVPTLDDNGFVIVDSHAICAYLVEKYAPNSSLYPKDLYKRTTIDARMHFDNGFLFARLRFLYESVFFFGQVAAQDRIEYIQRAWPLLEGFLANSQYIAGDELTIADLCAIATVSSVNDTATIDADKYPRIIAWMQRLSQLPYYEEKNGKGAAELQRFFKEKAALNLASAQN